MEIAEAESLLRSHAIIPTEIKAITGSFSKDIFLVNNAFVLRPSLNDMQQELQKFKRVENLDFVPKLQFKGTFQSLQDYNYLILSMLPGMDFIDAISDMAIRQQQKLGVAVAKFLDTLHGISGSTYDIGHYLPVIPNYTGTWKDGHIQYWDYLQKNVEKLVLTSGPVIQQALQYVRSNSGALDFQARPVLLHNDFHPKNIVVDKGDFSGVIDWECSQFGESDFDLCHLIHWCVYPPKSGLDFRPFLASVCNASSKFLSIPRLKDRLGIYQIEHELIQLIWSGGKAEPDRIPKLIGWLEGGVEDLFCSL